MVKRTEYLIVHVSKKSVFWRSRLPDINKICIYSLVLETSIWQDSVVEETEVVWHETKDKADNVTTPSGTGYFSTLWSCIFRYSGNFPVSTTFHYATEIIKIFSLFISQSSKLRQLQNRRHTCEISYLFWGNPFRFHSPLWFPFLHVLLLYHSSN